ncbi:hypothetical protein HID58_069622, partial [Brassica napus]
KDILERYRNLNLGKDVSAVLGQKKVKPGRKVKQWGLQLLGKDLSQVKDILERYRNLSDREKIKKNTNLSQFYNKKPVDEKRRSLTDAEVRKKDFGFRLCLRLISGDARLFPVIRMDEGTASAPQTMGSVPAKEEQAKIVSDQVDVEEDGGSIIAVSEEANLTSGNNQVAPVEEAWLSPTKKSRSPVRLPLVSLVAMASVSKFAAINNDKEEGELMEEEDNPYVESNTVSVALRETVEEAAIHMIWYERNNRLHEEAPRDLLYSQDHQTEPDQSPCLAANEICVIHCDREGNLVNTYPEDQCQVKDILKRYNRLSDREKIKKNTNLSQFYNKKLVDEKRRALTDAEERKKFTKKVGDFKGSLQDQFLILQDRARDLLYSQDHQTEPDQSRCLAAMSEQNHNFPAPSSGFFPHNDFSFSLIDEDPLMKFCPPVIDNLVSDINNK